jgi:hypothetical protein
MRPPSFKSPALKTTLTDPATPLVASFVRNTIDPLLPLDDVPVLKDMLPLVPDVSACPVWMLNDPLLVVKPSPENMETLPPVSDTLEPLLIATRPPEPSDPAPTTTLALPPTPSPDERPVLTTKDPLLPECAAPDVSINEPLTPELLLSAVCRLKEPDDTVSLYPLISDTAPPVDPADPPLLRVKRPPASASPPPTVTLTLPPAEP